MATRLGDHWMEILNLSHREALSEALCVLADDYLNDPNDEEHLLTWWLPERYKDRYSDGFQRRFFATLLTVCYKLALPEPPKPLLSCTAEELALSILIKQANVSLERDGLRDEFDLFSARVFEDLDHEWLYDPQNLRVEDLDHLRFEDWFEPFGYRNIPVHLYSAAE